MRGDNVNYLRGAREKSPKESWPRSNHLAFRRNKLQGGLITLGTAVTSLYSSQTSPSIVGSWNFPLLGGRGCRKQQCTEPAGLKRECATASLLA